MSHLYSGIAVQVDVQNDAEGLIEMIILLQRLCGLKQNAIEAVLTQQPIDSLEGAGIVIDHKNSFFVGQN